MREGETGWSTSLGQSSYTSSFSSRDYGCIFILKSRFRETKGKLRHETIIFTYLYFISSVFLLLITQISLAAFQVTLHVFNTHLRRASAVFAPTHGLGRAFIRCCASLRERCCFIEAHVNVHHVTEAIRILRLTG